MWRRAWKQCQLTTGMRAPQIRIREKERMRPILLEIFSYMAVIMSELLGRGTAK